MSAEFQPLFDRAVIVHFDKDGELNYHATVGVNLFIIDERAPHDRVYLYRSDATPADIAKIIGDDVIGHSQDARHAAIAHKILSYIEGKAHLVAVDGERDD